MEDEQANKKHRGKSKKLEKRETSRKNKKKTKQARHKTNHLLKHIKSKFREAKKYIHFENLNFDYQDALKYVTRLVEKGAKNDLIELFERMESGESVDLSGLEDQEIFACLVKLFKRLKLISFGVGGKKTQYKLPFKQKITDKYTTDEGDVITDSLESYVVLIKALIDFKNNNSSKEANKPRIKDEEEEVYESDLDDQYREIEMTLGNNAELINKTFDKIMRGDETLKKVKSKDEITYVNYSRNLIDKNVIISDETILKLNDSDDDISDKQISNNKGINKINNKDKLKVKKNCSDHSDESYEIGPNPDMFLQRIKQIKNIDIDDLLNEEVCLPNKPQLYQQQQIQKQIPKEKSLLQQHQEKILNTKSNYDHKIDSNRHLQNPNSTSVKYSQLESNNNTLPSTSTIFTHSKKTMKVLTQCGSLQSKFLKENK